MGGKEWVLSDQRNGRKVAEGEEKGRARKVAGIQGQEERAGKRRS